MKYFKIFFTILLICLSAESFGGGSQTDSLLLVLKSSTDNLEKLNTLIELSKISLSEPNQAIKYATEAQILARKLKRKKEEALANKYIGLGYSSQNMYVEATLSWQEAQKIFEEIDDKEGISNILSNLGTIYSNQGDDEKALELYLRSLQIAEEINAQMRILTVS